MAKSYFRDKTLTPTTEMLTDVLGSAKEMWDGFIQHIESTYPDFMTEWKFYGLAWGWSFIYSNKKKKLIYITPGESFFTATFSFNAKGHEMAKTMGFTEDVLRIIESGKTNPAGRTFDIPIKQQSDMQIVHKLLQIKDAC